MKYMISYGWLLTLSKQKKASFMILWFNALVLFAMLSSSDVTQGLKPRLLQLSVKPAKEGFVGEMDPCLLSGADHSDSLSSLRFFNVYPERLMSALNKNFKIGCFPRELFSTV